MWQLDNMLVSDVSDNRHVHLSVSETPEHQEPSVVRQIFVMSPGTATTVAMSNGFGMCGKLQE